MKVISLYIYKVHLKPKQKKTPNNNNNKKTSEVPTVFSREKRCFSLILIMIVILAFMTMSPIFLPYSI
jgi:hypothetical protein